VFGCTREKKERENMKSDHDIEIPTLALVVVLLVMIAAYTLSSCSPAFAVDVPCNWESGCNTWTVRGDANKDGVIDLTDGVYITNWLFLGGPKPPCIRQADMTGDGEVIISDVIYLYDYLFSDGPRPAQRTAVPINGCACAQDNWPNPDLSPCAFGGLLRGDVDRSGFVDSTDLIYLQNWLYNGGPPPRCLETADWNNNRVIRLNEGDFWINFLFHGGVAPCVNKTGCPDAPGCER
jgi:hypothetical protein